MFAPREEKHRGKLSRLDIGEESWHKLAGNWTWKRFRRSWRKVAVERNESAGCSILTQEPMRGIITTRDLVTCAPTIISQFGMAAYLRCWARAVLSKREVTFLECVCRMRQV